MLFFSLIQYKYSVGYMGSRLCGYYVVLSCLGVSTLAHKAKGSRARKIFPKYWAEPAWQVISCGLPHRDDIKRRSIEPFILDLAIFKHYRTLCRCIHKSFFLCILKSKFISPCKNSIPYCGEPFQTLGFTALLISNAKMLHKRENMRRFMGVPIKTESVVEEGGGLGWKSS